MYGRADMSLGGLDLHFIALRIARIDLFVSLSLSPLKHIRYSYTSSILSSICPPIISAPPIHHPSLPALSQQPFQQPQPQLLSFRPSIYRTRATSTELTRSLPRSIDRLFGCIAMPADDLRRGGAGNKAPVSRGLQLLLLWLPMLLLLSSSLYITSRLGQMQQELDRRSTTAAANAVLPGQSFVRSRNPAHTQPFHQQQLQQQLQQQQQQRLSAASIQEEESIEYQMIAGDGDGSSVALVHEHLADPDDTAAAAVAAIDAAQRANEQHLADLDALARAQHEQPPPKPPALAPLQAQAQAQAQADGFERPQSLSHIKDVPKVFKAVEGFGAYDQPLTAFPLVEPEMKPVVTFECGTRRVCCCWMHRSFDTRTDLVRLIDRPIVVPCRVGQGLACVR